MTWLLLFGLTCLTIVWPMLPALSEWARPTDTLPLQIDSCDTLDPPCLARAFAHQLATAVASGQAQLGSSTMAQIPALGQWPLTAFEQSTGSTQRVWHAQGDARMPAGVRFVAEVSAQGGLLTSGGIYRALWAGCQLELTPGTQVLRWAHGARVDVGHGCHLKGRISALEWITVGEGTTFVLLHAPVVRFLPQAAKRAETANQPVEPASVFHLGLPKDVEWDASAKRGVCESALKVEPNSAWRGDLVCRDSLFVGHGCNAHGSLKAQGDLVLAADTSVTGSVVAEGQITLKTGCRVRGLVVSETAIVIGSGCMIGTPDHPATVAAPRIQVASDVVVFGTLWAGERGSAEGLADALTQAQATAQAPNEILIHEAKA
jgi:hypothetical protein